MGLASVGPSGPWLHRRHLDHNPTTPTQPPLCYLPRYSGRSCVATYQRAWRASDDPAPAPPVIFTMLLERGDGFCWTQTMPQNTRCSLYRTHVSMS